MSRLWQLSAREVVSLLCQGKVSPSELLDEIELRCHGVNRTINALPTSCFDRARAHAQKLEKTHPSEKGPLCGLPLTIKDLTNVSGVRTTYGSTLYRDHVPIVSDRLVRRIERRGGIIYAKSNTPEFGTGGITFNEVFGPTRSPRNTAFASGGSSGGAAASLAAGCAWLSHGSDMAGSLRTPAAFCGVTSLRPSPGKISADAPLLPFDPLAQNGPMARDIGDLALFAIALFDEPTQEFVNSVNSMVKPQRVAISHDLGVTRVNGEILTVLDDLIHTLANAGCHIVADQPQLENVHETFDTLRAHTYAVSLEGLLAEHSDTLKPEIVWNVSRGMELSMEQLRQAQRQQGHLVEQAERFMQDYDLLLCPAANTLSVPADSRYPGFDAGIPVSEYYRWLAIAYTTTLTALPVITLPVADSEQGMPVAMQLVGQPGADARLLQHARWIEQHTSWKCAPIEPSRQ